MVILPNECHHLESLNPQKWRQLQVRLLSCITEDFKGKITQDSLFFQDKVQGQSPSCQGRPLGVPCQREAIRFNVTENMKMGQ